MDDVTGKRHDTPSFTMVRKTMIRRVSAAAAMKTAEAALVLVAAMARVVATYWYSTGVEDGMGEREVMILRNCARH